MTCNLVVYKGSDHKKKGESGYNKLITMAHEIAADMSDADKRRLQANPTPEMLKKIMEENT